MRARCPIAILASLALFGAMPGPVAADEPADPRLVWASGFEDAVHVPIPFPPRLVVRTPEDGFSRFGSIRLTDGFAAEGAWSLGFELDGGSIAAGLPSNVVPILPLADYRVTVRVRTSGLVRSRARLSAWLYDADGAVIPGSRVESAAVRTAGRWETLSILVPGEFPAALDIGLDMELLQPDRWQPSAAETHALQDVRGHAWFDDLTIRHEPRITIRPSAPEGIFLASAPPRFEILVRDLINEPLTARLRVEDIDGRLVFTRAFPAPRGLEPATVDVPLTEGGWYRADIEIGNASMVAGRSRVDFVLRPTASRPGAATDRRWGVILPSEHSPGGVENGLVAGLGVGSAVVPLTRDVAGSRALAEALLTTGIDPIFAVDGVPGGAGADPDGDFGGLPSAVLDTILVDFGLRAGRWLVARGHPERLAATPELDARLRAAEARLGRFVPEPELILSASPDSAALDSHGRTVLLTIPAVFSPDAIGDVLAAWRPPGARALVHLETLDADRFSPRQRVIDLLHRALAAWRAGDDDLLIDAPWTLTDDDGAHAIPNPYFVAWRGLADRLGGRRFAGTLPTGDPNLEAWIVAGDDPSDAALVIFDRAGFGSGAARRDLTLPLARGPVVRVDPFGNRTEVVAGPQGHRVEAEETPIFVEGVDLPLVRLASGLRFDPANIPAEHRIHDVALRIENPWPVPITGVVQILEHDGCEFTPRRREFHLGPGDDARIPFGLVLDRTVIGGVRRIGVRVQVQADRAHDLTLELPLAVAWPDLALTAHWSLSRNAITGAPEVLVTQVVHNRGSVPVNIDAYVIAPGEPHQRRPIGSLGPSATASRTFRLTSTPAELSGRTVRLGVAEHDGIGQISHLLALPALDGLIPVRRDRDPRVTTVTERP